MEAQLDDLPSRTAIHPDFEENTPITVRSASPPAVDDGDDVTQPVPGCRRARASSLTQSTGDLDRKPRTCAHPQAFEDQGLPEEP